VLNELVDIAGVPVLQSELRLSPQQVAKIYATSRFMKTYIGELMTWYLSSANTIHLAFRGVMGLHNRLNAAKGVTGAGTGLRGRYVTQYTSLAAPEFELWASKRHPNQHALDLEMYAMNLIHIADTQQDSDRAFATVFSTVELMGLRGFDGR
jgi:hypothetical protein